MVSHMKTTVEISDALLAEARKAAASDGITVRALIEQGLRRVLDDRKVPGSFRLRKTTFRGQGLQPDVAAADWNSIRDRAYEGRGA
jgi:hypothetical protein